MESFKGLQFEFIQKGLDTTPHQTRPSPPPAAEQNQPKGSQPQAGNEIWRSGCPKFEPRESKMKNDLLEAVRESGSFADAVEEGRFREELYLPTVCRADMCSS